MLRGTNQDQGQIFNRRVVLETVRTHGPLSRADLVRATGLSYQAVSNLAAELLGESLLSEKRRRDGRRGQPPVDLAINPAGAFSIGVAFDHRRLVAVVVDFAGAVRLTKEAKVLEPHPRTVLPLVRRSVHDLIRSARLPQRRFQGVGLVMPGLSQGGELVGLEPTLAHPWLSLWREPNLFAHLAAQMDLPLWTDNDAAAAALGERQHGAGRGLEDFVLIYISAGLGVGIIAGGQPFRGRHGKAGELGHMVVNFEGIPCPCGNRGCLERYASLASAQAAISEQPEGIRPVDAETLQSALAAGDPRLRKWLNAAATALRSGIASLENLLDPQAVLIGGTLPSDILDALVARIMPLPHSLGSDRNNRTTRLIRVEVGLRNAALGAAALPTFNLTAADQKLLFKRVGKTRPSGRLSKSRPRAAVL